MPPDATTDSFLIAAESPMVPPKEAEPVPAATVKVYSPLIVEPKVTSLSFEVKVVLPAKVDAPVNDIFPWVVIVPPMLLVPLTVSTGIVIVTPSLKASVVILGELDKVKVVLAPPVKVPIECMVPDDTNVPAEILIFGDTKLSSPVTPTSPETVSVPVPVFVIELFVFSKFDAQVISCPLVSILNAWLEPVLNLDE